MQDSITEYSTNSIEEIYKKLGTSAAGLKTYSVAQRLRVFGFNQIISKDEKGLIFQFLEKFSNPLIITLIIIAIISLFFGQKVNAIILILMAVFGVVLSFIQEYNASKNAKKLQEMVKIKVKVIRNGKQEDILINQIVPGDIIELSVGKMIPADARLIEAKNIYINQSTLNGESFPARKDAATHRQPETSSIYDIKNLAFMGSTIVSGFGKAVVIKTGKNTEFGQLAHELIKVKVETAFDKGIKNFTWLMIRFILILTLFIFAVNTLLKGQLIESLLFSLSIAVGLTPEMLPMIITVNLSKGALDMAKKKVIIKELDSIQNFGAMDVLCTDKTGTLTANNIALVRHCDVSGKENEQILRYAYINSSLQAGLENLLDKAVIEHKKFVTKNIKKVDEIPYDFSRRIMSVIIKEKDKLLMISKGAPEAILTKSTHYYLDGKKHKISSLIYSKLQKLYNSFSQDGFRVLAIAYKEVKKEKSYNAKDEMDLAFMGFMAFLDPPKPTTEKTINELEKIGIKLIILSGDNELVTQKIAQEVKFEIQGIMQGKEIDKLNDEQLKIAVEKYNIFARMSPLQKERVIKALQKNKHIVGFLGDGINDAPSLKAADVGISVDNAVDIAKETAEIILLEKDLGILKNCVLEGRKVFANVIKYIKMGASSNFGNMLSMTGASTFLPFLPMLPTQILLNNFLYDVSQISIPTDNVDTNYLTTPRPWNIDFIKRFIIYIGPISSIFDFLTFAIMIFVFRASPELFHTGWFVESLLTQVLVVHIIRTNKIPFIQSKPSKALLFSTIGIVLFSWLLPYSFLAKPFGFVPLPFTFFVILIVMSILYLLLTQIVKNWFIKKFGFE